VPEVVLDHSESVRALHRELLAAGAEVMVAFTCDGHREKLRAIGREDDLERLNRVALQLAREVAEAGDALVAGNICNTWAYDPARPDETAPIVRAIGRPAGAIPHDGRPAELRAPCRRARSSGVPRLARPVHVHPV
jgi:hypothetical protein